MTQPHFNGTELSGMSGKLVDDLRSADRSVEVAVRDIPEGRPERYADEPLPVPGVDVSHLAEPRPAAFENRCSNQHFSRCGNPAVVLAMADHNGLPGIDVLEALVYVADHTANCRQTAEKGLRAFGSVGAVLSASVHDLTTRLGIKEQLAYALKAIQAGMCSILRESIRDRVEIDSSTALTDYIGLSLKHELVEVLRVLYLDCKNGLISDEESHRGTVHHVALYPREIVRRALELGASAVILVHNHPSGDPTPSKADVTFSQQVACALSVMEIALHDSLIVGRHGFGSLRSLKKV